MKISVALGTYNGEAYIKEQLNSILTQSIKPDEIVICDDGSTDMTLKIAEEILGSCNVKFIIEKNESNLGVTKNFEKILSLTTGDIIFFSDQDDIWKSNKVEVILKRFNNNSKCNLVFTNATLVDKNRKKFKASLWDTVNFSHSISNNEDMLDILLNRCVVTGATMAIKRELYEQCRPFPKAWLHDGWLALNAALNDGVESIPMELIEYRQHDNNVVGVTSNDIIKKIARYLININKLESVRVEKFERYSTFKSLNNNQLSNDIKIKISESINFWSDMIKLGKINKFSGIKLIYSNYKKGNYKKYYTGIRGALRDVSYVLFVKR